MSIYNVNDVTKVVLSKTSKSKGPGGQPQPIPDDVIVENVGEEKEKEGEEKESEKDGEKEGEKEGEGKEGKDGEGKGEGKPGEGGDAKRQEQDIEQIKKRAQEILDEMEAADPKHHNCGSVNKRTDKQKEAMDKDADTFKEEEKFIRERIKSIIDEAAANGNEHPLNPVSRGQRGSGNGGGAPTGDLIPMQVRAPLFLKKMKQFAESEYEKQYYKKGTDWVWSGSGMFNDSVFFKDRPKVSVPKKSLYLLVDVSGSMFGDFDGKGNSLLDSLVGYLPVIAKDFTGQIWWMSNGILHWKKGTGYNLDPSLEGKPAITELSLFKGMDAVKATIYLKQVQGAEGAGSGTTFNAELQAVQDIREKEKNNAPIICLTDGKIDDVVTEYRWPLGKDKIKGKLPPNTYFMTDPNGISYMKRHGYDEDPRPDYFNYEKNIQYYDVTENGKYKTKNSR